MKDNSSQIPDTLNRMECFEDNGFFISKGKYYTYEFKGRNNKQVEIELSNFVGVSLFHLVNDTNNTRRIIKLQRNSGEISFVEILSSEMKPEAFETILKSKQCTFYGSSYHLKRIFSEWMDNENEAIMIETLGYLPVNKIYAFSNAIVTNKGGLIQVDELGIVNDTENNKIYYLPAYGKAHQNNQDYDGERKFRYLDGELNFHEWAKLYYDAFGSNGGIAILFLILSMFWDTVYDKIGFFPFLFLFGAYGTGKTSLVDLLLRIFGNDFLGIPLGNATQVALSRAIASRNNSIFYLKEYTPETDAQNQGLLLTAYDGSGRATGIKSTDNRTKMAAVKSAIILDGNHLPTQKTAVLSRMILLNFQDNRFSTKQSEAYNKLKEIQDKGFGKVLIEILQLRKYFEAGFKKAYDENIRELKKKPKMNFSERTLNHIALILTPAKLFAERLQFPFSFEEITEIVIHNAIVQNQLLLESNEITIFWESLAYGIKKGILVEFKTELNNKKYSHFNIKCQEIENSILQIKLQSIFPEYVKYCKNNGQNYLDMNSLKMLLTSKSYEAFIPNNQKGRGNAYTDSNFGSCYQFHLESNNTGYSINNVELNM